MRFSHLRVSSLVVLAGLAMGWSAPSLALAPGGAGCTTGYVNGNPQLVCWGDAGGGIGGGGGGSGGGSAPPPGGGHGSGVAVPLPGYPGIRINLTSKIVESDNMSCGDEEILRQRETQYYLVKSPNLQLNTIVTLKMPVTAETQRFKRVTSVGSIQFMPIAGEGCHK